MKLSELKIGDEITHYCSGKIVKGKVIELHKNGVTTAHEPVQWGKDTYTNTRINESSELQKKWGGKDENGNPAKGADTTPAAWYQGQAITV